MLASWVWILVTLFFLVGIKLYRPAKSTLPALLMAWSSTLFIVSLVLYLDGLLLGATVLSWEPMVLSSGVFVFCLPLYCKYLQVKNGQEKKNSKDSKAKAC